MTNLAHLRQLAEKATGPDRYLDAMIHLLVEPELGEAPWFQPHLGWWVDRGDAQRPDQHAPDYTASVDASLALVERLLPGWRVMAMGHGPHVVPRPRDFDYDGTWFCHLNTRTPGLLQNLVFANANTPPLAIILALLNALASLTPEQST